MKQIKILGIVGSLRKQSYNRLALQAAQELVPEGVSLTLCELHDIPLFNQDDEVSPAAGVLAFRRQILEADAILFCTPEYNYSIPGVLKNAIDWASRPSGQSVFIGKPGAIMGASPSLLGTARAQYQLRQVLVSQNMSVVNAPEVMIASAHQCFDEQGKLINQATKEHIQKLLASLVALAQRN